MLKRLLFISTCIFSSILCYGTEQPPYEVTDPAITENFREIYYSQDESSKLTNSFTVFVGSSTCIDSPTLCVDEINNRVGVGISSPTFGFHVTKQTYITGPTTISSGTVTTLQTGTIKSTSGNTAGTIDSNGGVRITSGTVTTLQTSQIKSTSGNTSIAINSSGYATNASQPMFLVYLSSSPANFSGDGTIYTIKFDTEVKDQSSSFTSNTFTAQITGFYHFDVAVQLNQLATTSHTAITLKLVTSNRTYEYRWSNHPSSTLSNLSFPLSTDADMDANDTATISIAIEGSSKVVDIIGTAAQYTRFSGHLIL